MSYSELTWPFIPSTFIARLDDLRKLRFAIEDSHVANVQVACAAAQNPCFQRGCFGKCGALRLPEMSRSTHTKFETGVGYKGSAGRQVPGRVCPSDLHPKPKYSTSLGTQFLYCAVRGQGEPLPRARLTRAWVPHLGRERPPEGKQKEKAINHPCRTLKGMPDRRFLGWSQETKEEHRRSPAARSLRPACPLCCVR